MRCLTHCLLSCIASCGCRNSLSRRLVFFPPSPPRYSLEEADQANLSTTAKPPGDTKETDVLVKNKHARLQVRVGVNRDKKLWLKDLKGNNIEPFEVPWVSTEIIFVETSRHNHLSCLYHQFAGADYTIIFSHGNSTDIGLMRNHMVDIAQNLKVNVFSYDYSGYGLSSGKPSEENLYADIRAVYSYLTSKHQVPWYKIILYGQSVGSGPTCDMASDPNFPVGALILHSAFASALRIVIKDHKSRSKSYDLFRNIDKMSRIQAPLYIIHGKEDAEVPIKHAEALYDTSKRPYVPWWVEKGDHNSIEISFRSHFMIRLRNFFEHIQRFHRALTDSERQKLLRPLPPGVRDSRIEMRDRPIKLTTTSPLETSRVETDSASEHDDKQSRSKSVGGEPTSSISLDTIRLGGVGSIKETSSDVKP